MPRCATKKESRPGVTSEAVSPFPPFPLDCITEQLWRGSQVLPLRPKSFAVLHYLAEHPHRLVTKEELLKAVWLETYVSAGLLHAYIRDLRDLLGDDRQAPRCIETVARRGYRFIAPLLVQEHLTGIVWGKTKKEGGSRGKPLEHGGGYADRAVQLHSRVLPPVRQGRQAECRGHWP
jgi:DNA-binding winged helix-turn-helix (wHTH) protein